MNKTAQLGSFFVVGIIVLLILFEVVSGVSFYKKEKTYISFFPTVGELRVGSEVKLSGVEVGRVKNISLSGQNVQVVIAVNKDVIIKEDSEASINMTSSVSYTHLTLPTSDLV